MKSFTHLHVHSQYSILDGAATIEGIIKKVKNNKMTAVALTDHGDMHGIKHFHKVAKNHGIKPILGVEAYMARNSRKDKRKENKADKSGYHLILLAKNYIGYKNLLKLCSLAHIEGFYYKPRIDREILEKYKEGLIATSACLGGEIPQKILKNDDTGIAESIEWYQSIFKDDFYLEIMRHPTGNSDTDKHVFQLQEKCNKQILSLAQKYNIEVIATNDSHFLDAEDADSHDILICLKTGKFYSDINRMKYTGQEFLKTKEEMIELFKDVPNAIENTQKLANKIEIYNLNQPAMMPDFSLPNEFSDANQFLRHLSYEGAKERWGNDLNKNITKRLDYELEIIKKMGFPGYFLIIWDFIKAAKEKNVIVGPGRGSVAGSVVAYCIGITEIDPLKYKLLFERFLNPDRISMPDIDIDLDDEGRQKMLDWVVKKYGEEKVAQIVTFGRMATRSSIRDVGRVLQLPLPITDRLAKLVPRDPNITFKSAYRDSPELKKEKTSENHNIRKTLKVAESLEGSIRQRGIHACGIIVGKEPLIEHIPLMQAKDTKLLLTQYEGTLVEEVGMLKMDFLGLKTLSILKDTIKYVKKNKNIDINLNEIPLDDKKTIKLFSKGETVGVFQFESNGMRKYLKELLPNSFKDIYSMNALYRPGPMNYIPSFIKRKHNREEISYDHPLLEKYLKETYGITLYQEQVMQLAVELAGFTRGEADTLRKAMGKKIKSTMESKKEQFTNGCLNNSKFIDGCKKINQNPNELINKIWQDWVAFANYAFNKSHAVSYSYLAFQSAYLKAHYPDEFMASLLSRNLSEMDELKKYMQECKRMNINILGPDINESKSKFSMPQKGIIRFGLSAIKGVGEKSIESIIAERERKGKFNDIFNFFERINLNLANKTTFENIAAVGGFDCFGYNRSELCQELEGNQLMIEKLIHYGQLLQQEKDINQLSLFGGVEEIEIVKPKIPHIDEWHIAQKAKIEKELIGIYLTAHPLDDYKIQVENLITVKLADFKDNFTFYENKAISIGGFVFEKKQKFNKNNNPYGRISIEDYSGVYELMLFGEDFNKFYGECQENQVVIIKGRVVSQSSKANANSFTKFKIDEIMTIEVAEKKLIKQLQLNFQLQHLSEDLIDKIKNFINDNGGTTLLRFNIIDAENNIRIKMISGNKRIKVDQKLFDFLKENKNIDYQFN